MGNVFCPLKYASYRNAYPSIVTRSNGGKSLSAHTFSARVLPMASFIATNSSPKVLAVPSTICSARCTLINESLIRRLLTYFHKNRNASDSVFLLQIHRALLTEPPH